MAIGDHLRHKMTLWGSPLCINTAQCLMTAGEKGTDIQAALFSPDSSEVKSMSPLGIGPILRDDDHVVVGRTAIMSYLDDKGFGPSLMIRNAVVRATQHQWSQYAADVVQPNLDDDQILSKALKCFNEQLLTTDSMMKGDFICGQFSLVDVHWAACINMLHVKGKSGLVNANPAIDSWWQSIKHHSSTSKEKLYPFECLPTKADMDSNTLRDININT